MKRIRSVTIYRVAGVLFLFVLILAAGLCIRDAVGDASVKPYVTVNGSTLLINEVLFKNLGAQRDADGGYSDWIELYNAGTEPVSLAGWSLSDRSDPTVAWRFPDISLAAGEYLAVFASGKDRSTAGAELHTDFRLRPGETVRLFFPDGSLADRLALPDTSEYNLSVGRTYGFPSVIATLKTPSFCRANRAGVIGVLCDESAVLPPAPEFSVSPGIYSEEFTLALSTDDPAAEIYYTLDGEEPTSASLRYTGPIAIHAEGTATHYADIKTTASVMGWRYDTSPGTIYKGTVVRAITESGGLWSDVRSGTYFIAPDYTLPIVSIIADPDDLFDDEKGIYVPGIAYQSWKRYHASQANDYETPGNYSIGGEIPVVFEYHTPDGTLALCAEASLSLYGGSSRGAAYRSLKLTAVDALVENGFPLDPFSGSNRSEADGTAITQYSELVLRNSGNDCNYTLLADAFVHRVSETLHLPTQAYQPCIVFIDGEYWGIHNIREVYCPDYFANHYGVSRESVSLIKYHGMYELQDGSADALADFNALCDYILAQDMCKAECLAYVAERIDLENLIDYLCCQLYFANIDWPQNNQRLWKSDDGSKWGDGRWRFVPFDMDASARDATYSSIGRLLAPGSDLYPSHSGILETTDDLSAKLFRALMENDGLRQRFCDTMLRYTETVFSAEAVVSELDRMVAVLEPEITEHFARWPLNDSPAWALLRRFITGEVKAPVQALAYWRELTDVKRRFALERPACMRRDLDAYMAYMDAH